MGDDVLIRPLDLSDFDPSQVPDNPGFTDLVNQELSDLGTDHDGFQGIFDELTGFVDALDSGLSLLGGADGGTLDDTFAEALTIDPTEPIANAADFQAQLPTFDQTVTDMENLVASGSPPIPPRGGGGGPLHDIPTSTGPLLGCVDIQGWPTPGAVPLPTVQRFTLSNTGTAALAITGVQWISPKAGQFTARTDLGTTLAPGATFTMEVTQHTAAVIGDVAELVVTATGFPNPYTWCINVGGVSAGGLGGGGGGTPPARRVQ